MHDAHGKPLKVGDTVLIPARITNCGAFDDYCNVSVETLIGRRPDGAKEHMSAINTGVMFRANVEDGAPDISDLASLPVKL